MTQGVPVYQFNRGLTTVQQAFHEWTTEIEPRDNEHGALWRPNQATRQWHSRRKKIMDFVKQIAIQESIPIEQAVDRVEQQRKELHKSLDGLSKWLTKRNE